jgi:TetR/AcrR family transcriptional repressor of nem operon
MARPKEFLPDEAVDRAKLLFWKKGYGATSVQDLVKSLRINRGSLYGTFRDKRALFVAALDRYTEQDIGASLRVLRTSTAAGRERIQAFFDAVIRGIEDRGDRRGCLLCNTAVDEAARDAAIAEHVKAGLERIEAAFAVALASDPTLPTEPERRDRRVYFLTSTLMGIYVMTRAGATPEVLRGIVRVAMRGLP